MNRPGVSTDSHTKPSGVAARRRGRLGVVASDSPSAFSGDGLRGVVGARAQRVSPRARTCSCPRRRCAASPRSARSCRSCRRRRGRCRQALDLGGIMPAAGCASPPSRRRCRTARVGSEDAGKGVVPSRATYRERASSGTMERVSLDVREQKYRAPCTTAGETRAGTARGVGAGWRGPARGFWPRPPWLPIRVARGSRARARAPASGVRARAGSRRRRPRRARITPRHRRIAFRLVVSCVRACACRLLPLRPPRRVRVRSASASGRSSATARRHGRACGPPDAHRYCALPTTRGSFRIGTRARRTDANESRTRENQNARIDFGQIDLAFSFFRGV